MSKVLAIPDIHAPFQDTDAILKIYAWVRRLQPTHIVCLGDEYDMYSFSKFPRSQNLMTPKEELAEGRAVLQRMWKNVQKEAPKAKCIQLRGNHSARIEKRLIEKFPEAESIFTINHLFEFDGVKTIHDDRGEFAIDDVIYTHGFASRLGAHMHLLHKSVVRGHSHRAGIVYEQIGKKVLFEMECGHVADTDSTPLRYTAVRQKTWIKCFGWIDENGPRLITL